MWLRRLELMGFKSFADRTTIDFGQGICAIVGPNGSGKSNITDAVRWVLGEASARALRGVRMEDVIFGGTPRRRPVPLAEVTLVLDNSDGTLAVPFAEVAVTRRVDRSGTSDYLLNRSACRLRDIQDLFAGTGLSRNAFALVGQGEVDEVLRARPADRRAMVEEAAGVTRYRQRLHEGNRRLAAAGISADRLGDLLGERQQALSALARQAERAERHAAAAVELRALDMGIWALQWRTVQAERAAAQTAVGGSGSEHEALAEELITVAGEQRELGTALAAARVSLEAQTVAYQEAERALDRARQAEALAAGLQAAAVAEGQRSTDRLAELEGRVGRQADAAAVAQAAQTAAAAGLAEARAALAAATATADQATGARARATEAFSAARAALLAASRAVAAASGPSALEAAREALQGAADRAATLAEEHAQCQVAQAAATAAVAPAAAQARGAAAAAAALSRHRDALAAAIGGLRGRVRVLAEVAASGAGYAQGPRTVLAGRRRGDAAYAGVIGVLGELISVPRHLSEALAAALGGAAADVVTESAAAAALAIEALKASGGGRATFLPLGALSTAPLAPDLQSLAARPGAVGWAADLCGCDEAVRPAVLHALGRVLVARDLDAARALARTARYRLRIVTLEGDVVHPGGAMSGGRMKGERPGGLLGRGEERTRLEARLAVLQGDLARVEAALASAAAAAEGLAEAHAQARRTVAAADAALSAAAAAGAQAERERRQREAAATALARQLEATGQPDPDKLAEDERLATDRASAAGAALAAAEGDEARAREAVTAARIALAETTGKLTAAEEAIRRAQGEAQDLAARLAEVQADRQRAAATAAAQAAAAQAAAAEIATAEHRLQRVGEARRAAVADVDGHSAAAAAAARRREWLDQQRDRVAGELRRAEAALGRAETAAAALAARLETAYGLPLEALEGIAVSDHVARDQQRAAALRQELGAIGGVRPEAVSEYQTEAEALATFSAAVHDVAGGRALLFAWGREIEAALVERYDETLAAVRAQFATVYARLCGGGTADLLPVAPPPGPAAGAQPGAEADALPGAGERPAAAPGLEIVAQPPGKQLAHMGLLSGGERTLVAIALVLAFLQVRPTAFCLLDEVEAALDEGNVLRWAAYLREVAEHTQFIVVTHQKGTMETADRLVGVTMSEPGVTSLLSVRLAG